MSCFNCKTEIVNKGTKPKKFCGDSCRKSFQRKQKIAFLASGQTDRASGQTDTFEPNYKALMRIYPNTYGKAVKDKETAWQFIQNKLLKDIPGVIFFRGGRKYGAAGEDSRFDPLLI